MRKTGLKRWAIPILLCVALSASCALLGYSFSSTGYEEAFGPAYDKGTSPLNLVSGRDVRFELNARIDEGSLAVKIYNPSNMLVKEYSIASTGVTRETFPYERGVWTVRLTSAGGKGYFKVRLHDKRDYEGF
mgnify:CR=1 FL=1